MVTSADAAMRALRGKEIDGNNLLICKLTRDVGIVNDSECREGLLLMRILLLICISIFGLS